jgi:AAA15 family ATPase/GTPase
VGKSNILEAIGLFSLPYVQFNQNKSLAQFVRLDNLSELFFDGDKDNFISIKTDTNKSVDVRYEELKEKRFDNSISVSINIEHRPINVNINSSLNISMFSGYKTHSLYVIYYKFIQNFRIEKQDDNTKVYSFLIPPFGVNLVDIIQDNKELKKELVSIFSEYNLKLLFDKGSHSLRIMKETKDGEVFSLPYDSIADTLQRVIFYKAAIASNKNSILLFEEPEAHCFPPYIAHFTQDVLNSETNQFFIATHSPYVLNDFLEYNRDDVAIYMADFKDGQTVIYRLTDDEVNEVYNDGIDVFFNYERYTQHG